MFSPTELRPIPQLKPISRLLQFRSNLRRNTSRIFAQITSCRIPPAIKNHQKRGHLPSGFMRRHPQTWVAGIIWNTQFTFDADMGFRHAVSTQKVATEFLDKNFTADTGIRSDFPMNNGLEEQQAGYTKRNSFLSPYPCRNGSRKATFFNGSLVRFEYQTFTETQSSRICTLQAKE
jgi:hypothetical protein